MAQELNLDAVERTIEADTFLMLVFEQLGVIGSQDQKLEYMYREYIEPDQHMLKIYLSFKEQP